jgi:hypothetical protein
VVRFHLILPCYRFRRRWCAATPDSPCRKRCAEATGSRRATVASSAGLHCNILRAASTFPASSNNLTWSRTRAGGRSLLTLTSATLA